MLEEYQAVTSPTVKRRPVPAAAPVPPGDGAAPPFAVMAVPRSSPPPAKAAPRRARAGGEIWGMGGRRWECVRGSLGWVGSRLNWWWVWAWGEAEASA